MVLETVRLRNSQTRHLRPAGHMRTLCGIHLMPGSFYASPGPVKCNKCNHRRDAGERSEWEEPETGEE